MKQLIDSQLRLDLLREALPYIQRFKGKTFVVKFSGKVTEDRDHLISLCEELALLHQVGIRICVIHGGGKQLSDEEKKQLYDTVKRTYDEQTDPRYGAARLWIDKIIDPVDTRDAITTALEAAALNPDVPEFKVGVLQT